MLANIGRFFAEKFRRLIPDSFVFALLLTVFSGGLALIMGDSMTPFKVIQAWYQGFWDLLRFAMQMILILVTGYAIALSPPAARLIDMLASRIRTPAMVYVAVVIMGCMFSMISWGLIVLTAVLGRELALKVRRVDYHLLAACVYTTMLPWHGGLSGSVPLLLNTPNNFLIETGVLTSTISTTMTLGSTMNMVCILLLLVTLPFIMVLMRPSSDRARTHNDLKERDLQVMEPTVSEEAEMLRLPDRNLSDGLNNSFLIQLIMCLAGLWFLVWYFMTRGFDANLDIMNFLFIIIGLICHRTPARYGIAMKRSCKNV